MVPMMKLIWVFLVVQLQCCMSRGDIQVEEITNEAQRCELGEAPHWDVARQSLYYVDIAAPAIFRFDCKTGGIFRATVIGENAPIGFFTPVEGTNDEFVIGAGRKILLIRWDGKSGLAAVLKVLTEVDLDQPTNRINDGKVDPKGVLFFGTMGDESTLDLAKTRIGTFYSFKNETGTAALKGGIGISNGLTWDVKRKKFYYIDSITRDVKQFNYDPVTSVISNETVLIDFDKTHSDAKFAADGMTIDADGTLYVATWGGSRVIVINPDTKEVVREIPIPTSQVTSLAFGGPKLDILYATTAGKPKPQPAPAGGLFKITGLGVKGLPMDNFKLY